MKLAEGIILNPDIVKNYVNDAILYRAEAEMYVNSIFLINTADYPVTLSLTVLYDSHQINLVKPGYVLNAGDPPLEITKKLYLSALHEIRCNTATDNVVQYIINGGAIADEANDPSVSSNVYNSTTVGTDIDSQQIFKLIPAEAESTEDRAYNDYSRAQNIARQSADSATPYLVNVREPGTITVEDGGLSGNSDFNDYVNIQGINRGVKLILSNVAYSVTADTVLIENVNVRFEASGTGTPTMTGFKFKDVYFNIDCSTFTFINCKFEGICYVKATAGTVTFTTCSGGMVVTNADPGANMFGYFGSATTDF